MKSPPDEKKLPIIGPATEFLRLPFENPELVLKGLRGEMRAFAEAELAIARCDFARGKLLSEQLIKSDKYFLAVVRIAIISAIGLGDLHLFDRILARIADYRRRLPHPLSGLGVDLSDAWLRQWLWLDDGYPDWMCRFDFSNVPDAWRQAAAYLGMKIRIQRGQFESAYAASSLFLNFVCPQRGITASCAYAKISCAIACRETGRKAEMMSWLGDAVHTLAPHRILLPFLLFMHGSSKSPVEELLADVAPEQVLGYRELSKTYFRNLIRARNHYTGERATERLSFREFYMAMLLKRSLSYKELTERLGISVGRVRNLVSILYEKLDVHSRSELKNLVW